MTHAVSRSKCPSRCAATYGDPPNATPATSDSAPNADDVERQRVGAHGVQEHRQDDVCVLRLNDGNTAEHSGRNEPLQRRMRMVDEIDAERAEQISRLKEVELGRAQRLPHPPEVPQKAVVVAAQAGNVIAEVKRKRPRPDDGHGRQQCERRDVSSQGHARILV